MFPSADARRCWISVQRHLGQDARNWPTQDDPSHPTSERNIRDPLGTRATRCFHFRCAQGVPEGTGKPGMQY